MVPFEQEIDKRNALQYPHNLKKIYTMKLFNVTYIKNIMNTCYFHTYENSM